MIDVVATPVANDHLKRTPDSEPPMSAFSSQIKHTDTREHLAPLWRRRLDTLIAGVANGDPYYQQIANAAEHISAEYQGRFLIELLQNANDQAIRAGLTDSLVTITRTDRIIAVGNSGQPFVFPFELGGDQVTYLVLDYPHGQYALRHSAVLV